MFLKRLEIVGFKSFAERIAVDFVPGVTAVVGPNGSGKSNITDAIRWVLGEQSAKSLRGTKMEDVIFAGSDSRKPLNFAEVTLVLDNQSKALHTEYAEVSVTRRVYRSGDSDYLLNRQTCRLKDITELFMDSGLGREAFSIISQGKVDEILNSKAEDRRAIFEETAGVLKYKQRKRKAEFKLIETDDNLNRVLDILHELEGRIEPLQIQSSIAKDYLAFAEELRTREVSLALFDIEQAEDQLEVLAKHAEEVAKEVQSTRTQKEELVLHLTQARSQLSQLEESLDTLQDEAVTVSTTLERQEGRKLVLEEKQNNRKQQIEKLQASLAVAKQEAKQLEEKHEQLEMQKKEQAKKIKELRDTRNQLEQILHTSEEDLEVQVETLKADYIELLNESAALKNEQRILEQQTEKQKLHYARFSTDLKEIERQLDEARNAHNLANASKEQLDHKLEQTLLAFKEKKVVYDDVSQSYEKKRQLLFDGYQQLHQLRAKRDSLVELESEFSGYFQGVRELLKQRNEERFNGIRGAVAELLDIPTAYVTAIDTAIGGQAQHVVTDTTRDAQHAIAYLKQQRLGRATFLPMDVIKPRQLPDFQLKKLENHAAFVATANTLVSCEPEYRPIRDNLLGTIVVAKDLNGASLLAKLINHSARIVTLDGDIVHPGGSLTGGTTKKQSSVFSRKADLENYSTLVVKLEADLARAEQQVADFKRKKDQLETELETLRSSGEELRSNQQQVYSEAASAENLVEKWQDKKDMFHLQQQEHGDDQQQATTRLNEIEQLLAERSQKAQSIQSQIDELTALKSKTVEQKDAIQNQLGTVITEVALASERAHQLDRELTALSESIAKATTQITSWEEELAWYQTGHEGQTAEELAAEIGQLVISRNSLQTTIQSVREKRKELNHQVRAAELEEEAVSERLHTLSVQHEKLNMQNEQLESSLASYYSVLEDDYELTYEDAKQTFSLPEDSDRERSKVRLLKRSIEELGPVNIAAIEEFEQVNERYQFLTEQRKDLIDAKDTLHSAITEMDEEMTERFSRTFFEIQKHFRDVFRKLFGGGQADLVLTDPENMLETGVDIVAQPPGKKLQNLSLLSGGERALTAIALLFAILQTRPVPFCILDEVEAALDEANVVRYSEYLKQFSGDTQFIVITHRKGTMEGADVLYGVTMQESGVSKLVSVKLEEYV